MDPCTHPEELIFEDFQTADRICIKCAKVIDRIYAENIQIPLNNMFAEYKSDQEKIRNYFSFLKIEATSMILEAKELVENISSRLCNESTLSNIPRKKVLIAYAIWETCNINRCPRAIDEIAQICGVRENQMMKLEKLLSLEQTYCSAKDYIPRILRCLEAPYCLHPLIKHVLTYTARLNAYKPVNIIAAIVIQLYRLHNSKRLFNYEAENIHNSYLSYFRSNSRHLNKQLTVRHVCVILGTPSAVIYKLMKRISEDKILEILDEKKVD